MSVQNHVHISTTLGGAPENAPNLTWKVIEYDWEPLVMLNIEYTRTMELREQLPKVAGDPVVLDSYSMKLLIYNDDPADSKTQLLALRNMIGRRIYFVPLDHAADGADHTADVVTMVFGKLGGLRPLDPMLRYYEPTFTLHPVQA